MWWIDICKSNKLKAPYQTNVKDSFLLFNVIFGGPFVLLSHRDIQYSSHSMNLPVYWLKIDIKRINVNAKLNILTNYTVASLYNDNSRKIEQDSFESGLEFYSFAFLINSLIEIFPILRYGARRVIVMT